MKEKIYEFPINHSLTATKRKKIDRYIADIAHLAPSKVTAGWDQQNPQMLRISTPPVSWEVHFDPKKVEVYGSGPFWARLLFTENKRALLKDRIKTLLQQTGFFESAKNAK
jgi:hypothetical protein